jgi:hypothetical protein
MVEFSHAPEKLYQLALFQVLKSGKIAMNSALYQFVNGCFLNP